MAEAASFCGIRLEDPAPVAAAVAVSAVGVPSASRGAGLRSHPGRLIARATGHGAAGLGCATGLQPNQAHRAYLIREGIMTEFSEAMTIRTPDELVERETSARSGPASSADVIIFGPFSLVPTERLLLKSGKPVPLGSRALDILIALVERPGELVSKAELMARVWPSVNVVGANLTVHMTALRHALADGKDGNRYIVTVPGRGYCFVSTVKRERRVRHADDLLAHGNLPAPVRPLVGRLDGVTSLMARILEERLLTIVGPGGVGKTSVAVTVSQALTPLFSDGVFMVDLAALRDSRLVATAVAAALGLVTEAEWTSTRLAGALENRSTLLVIDSCEHMIDGVSALVADLLRLLPGLRILATSREPLRVEGERVWRLSGLESPPARDFLSAADALAFPAVQLFVEHAEHWGFRLVDFDASDVAQICRRLDGVPLAITLAAAHVSTLGIRGILARLDDAFSLLTSGQRSSPMRQKSVLASIEWSYRLLTNTERLALQRLSLFDGEFTLRAACNVGADAGFSEHELIDLVRELATKSLILVEANKSEPHFRLSETTRFFARRELAVSGKDAVSGLREAGARVLHLPTRPSAMVVASSQKA
jgi:predicted ATPase/DNA-binding winged helix-turn-helix (wHTH) protein